MQQQRPTTWPERGLSFFVSFRFFSHGFLLCFLRLSLDGSSSFLSRRSYPAFSVPLVFASRVPGPWSSTCPPNSYSRLLSRSALALPYLCSVLCLSVCPRVLPASAVYVYVCMCLYPLPCICRFVVHQQFTCKSILNSIAGSIALRFWDGTGLDDE